MTKARTPGSIQDAVAQIWGALGIANAAAVVGKAERTVRNWSDPDTGALPTIEEAMLLDAAYVRAGRGDPPIMALYALSLDRLAEPTADAAAIAASIKAASREGAEALGALGEVLADPNCDPLLLAVAEKECMEAGEAYMAAARRIGTKRGAP